MDLAERPEQVKTRQRTRIGKSHSFVQQNWQARFLRFAAIATVFGALSACQESLPLSTSGRAVRPIPSSTLTLMREKGTNSHAPVLIRTYKKEAELEIWKMKADGRYTLLKTFPM
jgi:murein L,D-transpeptidase YafK